MCSADHERTHRRAGVDPREGVPTRGSGGAGAGQSDGQPVRHSRGALRDLGMT